MRQATEYKRQVMLRSHKLTNIFGHLSITRRTQLYDGHLWIDIHTYSTTTILAILIVCIQIFFDPNIRAYHPSQQTRISKNGSIYCGCQASSFFGKTKGEMASFLRTTHFDKKEGIIHRNQNENSNSLTLIIRVLKIVCKTQRLFLQSWGKYRIQQTVHVPAHPMLILLKLTKNDDNRKRSMVSKYVHTYLWISTCSHSGLPLGPEPDIRN